MKRNTKIHILQVVFASIGIIQLVEGAIFMGLISVFIVYGIGAFENGE